MNHIGEILPDCQGALNPKRVMEMGSQIISPAFRYVVEFHDMFILVGPSVEEGDELIVEGTLPMVTKANSLQSKHLSDNPVNLDHDISFATST